MRIVLAIAEEFIRTRTVDGTVGGFIRPNPALGRFADFPCEFLIESRCDTPESLTLGRIEARLPMHNIMDGDQEVLEWFARERICIRGY